MAKKNSTKTATKEALQATEPRVAAFYQWAGINIKEAPVQWSPLDDGHNQTDLRTNYLAVQNNLVTTSQKALETRLDAEVVAKAPSGLKLTSVSYLHRDRLICAFSDKSLRYHVLGDAPTKWTKIPVTDPDPGQDRTWTHILVYLDTLICLTDGAEIFTGPADEMSTTGVSSALTVPNPTDPPKLEVKGDLKEGDITRIQVCYAYTNKFGYTLPSRDAVITVDSSPVEWSYMRYMKVSGTAPTGYGITGVDMYFSIDENQDKVFGGHVTLSDGGAWSYNWLGAMDDTSMWTTVSLTVPTENTTKGVNARHASHHDGRLYFYGGDDEYRLWIGGNPGSELSVARGVGGGFVDVEPGSGTVINRTHKFKTYNGASIVTLMCGNVNTSAVKRFNLLETNVTLTNEISSKGYMYEEVSNVIGSNGYWGSGVFADGLYALSRYGLAVTTQAMESNNQLRAQLVSDAIQPVFTDRISSRLNDARMLCVDDIIYIVLSQEESDELDRVVLCYDINQKAWYTMTYGSGEEESNAPLLHVMSIDYEGHWEGLGLITEDHVAMIPLTGAANPTKPKFHALMETGELSSKSPLSATDYVAQLELRFDYFVGEVDVQVIGVDYYGREFRIDKHIEWDECRRDLAEWIRVDMYCESYRLIIKGPARFRLTHVLTKVYSQSKKVNLVYGFDDRSSYVGRHGKRVDVHHYLDSYNNLRDAIIP